MQYLKNRLREPSTWLGLAMLLSQGAAAVSTRDPAAIGAVVTGLAGVLMPEGKAAK